MESTTARRAQPNAETTVPRLAWPAWVAPIGLASFWMLVIWLVHRSSPRTLISFHGLLHSAIAERFLGAASFAFPPENPFYAGQGVAYYWFFQFVGGLIARLTGVDVLYALEAIVLVATAALMIGAISLGRTLYRSTLAGGLIGYLVVAGANPLGFVYAGWTILREGSAALRDDPNYLWGVVHPLYSLIRYNDFGGLYGPLFNFFLNITSRPAALAALLLLVWSLRRYLLAPNARHWGLVLLLAALTTAFSPIQGLPAGAALVGGLALAWAWEHRGDWRETWRGPSARAVIAASAGILLGLVLAAPTYYHLILGPSDSQVQFWLVSRAGLQHLLSTALASFALYALAILGYRHAPPNARPFLLGLIVGGTFLLALDVAFTLPVTNQSNFFHAAIVLLAVPAAASVMRRDAQGTWTARRHITGAVVLVFMPTLLLLATAYVGRPGVPVSLAATLPARTPASGDLGALYHWIQAQTEPDAIFVVDPHERVAVAGNSAELPAMTGRVLLTEDVTHYLVSPYRDSAHRVDLASRLVLGEGASDADHALLAGFRRSLYIVNHHAEDVARQERLRALYGAPAFEQGGVAVFRWK